MFFIISIFFLYYQNDINKRKILKTYKTYIFLTFFLCPLKFITTTFLEQRPSRVGWPSTDRSICRKIKITKLINRVFYLIVAFKYPIEMALRAVLLSITRAVPRKKKKEKKGNKLKKREKFPLWYGKIVLIHPPLLFPRSNTATGPIRPDFRVAHFASKISCERLDVSRERGDAKGRISKYIPRRKCFLELEYKQNWNQRRGGWYC